MHIQGHEFRFEGINITVAYFSDEPALDFDEKVPVWLGDECPVDDAFNDFESFIFRKAGGMLIIAVSDLTGEEMKVVNEMVAESLDDHIKLLICSERKRYQAPQFDAVITSSCNLVNSMFHLAFAVYASSKIDESAARNITDLNSVIRQSRSGTLVCYWEAQKIKNRIDPCDVIEEWPMRAEEGARVIGLWTWLNPANYRWSKKTKSNFVDFARNKLNRKSIALCSSGSYGPEYSRSPAPDVMQLIMI